MKKIIPFALSITLIILSLTSHVVLAADSDADGIDEATDCDDTDPDVYPGAVEECNGTDNNCSGDENDALDAAIYYQDSDGDGFGNASVSQSSCSVISDYVSDNTDCDDANSSVNPTATESCNGADDNCDGSTDEGLSDADSDGTCDALDTEECSGADNDGDGLVDCDDSDCAADEACVASDPEPETEPDDEEDPGDDTEDETPTSPEPEDEEETETTFTELEADNDAVDFAALAPGETISLSAPDPRVAALVKEALPSTCSCEWSVDDDTLATLSASNVCDTELTPVSAGSGTLSVSVNCGAEGTGLYRQSFTVTTPDPADNAEGDGSSSSGCSLNQDSGGGKYFGLSLICALLSLVILIRKHRRA